MIEIDDDDDDDHEKDSSGGCVTKEGDLATGTTAASTTAGRCRICNLTVTMEVLH